MADWIARSSRPSAARPRSRERDRTALEGLLR